MNTNPPTEKQLELLQHINRLMSDRHGIPPTIQELAGSLRITATAVKRRLHGLIIRGLMHKEPRVARGLVVTDTGAALLEAS